MISAVLLLLVVQWHLQYKFKHNAEGGSFAGPEGFACFHANISSNVRLRMGLPMYIAICFVLLSFCSLPSFAFRSPEGRHIRRLQRSISEGNSLEDTANVSISSLESNFSSALQTASTPASKRLYGDSAEPSESSIYTATTIKATLQTILGVSGFLGRQSLDVSSTVEAGIGESERQFHTSGPSEELGRNGPAKATVMTAPVSNIHGDVLSSATRETVSDGGARPTSTGNPYGDVFTPIILEGGKKISELATAQPTMQGRMANLPGTMASDHTTNPSPPIRQSVGSEQTSNGDEFSVSPGAGSTAKPTDGSIGLEVEGSDSQGHSKWTPGTPTSVPVAVPLSDDWDDTKLAPGSQARATQPEAPNQLRVVTEPYPPAEGEEDEEDDVKRVPPPRISETPAKGSKGVQAGSGLPSMPEGESATLSASLDSVHGTHPSVNIEAPAGNTSEEAGSVVTNYPRSIPESATTTDVTKSGVFQTPGVPLRG
ncbi:hypothetical protein JD844_020362 [Phrynosoma platyrhinos]|uniref:Transmembrane protein n=1 Tax=Phrynosoma platyrhinos TaxID=52577 RepID=A0ABQ7SSF9_PHRPL|nr:hypothetical protein JD844_020362 [Phrynosoma platyrhinos]